MTSTILEGTAEGRLTQRRPSRVSSAYTARRAPVSLATDGLSLIGALALAELTSAAHVPATPVPWMLAFAVLVLGFLHTQGMYRPPLDLRILDDSRAVVTATALATAIVISVRVVLTDSAFVAAQSARAWVFATAVLVAVRIGTCLYTRHARRAGAAGQPTLIVGAGDVGQLVATRLQAHPEIGLKPVGFLDADEPLYPPDELAVPVLGENGELETLVEERAIEHVIVTSCTAPDDVLVTLVKRCEALGVRTSVVPRLYEQTSDQLTVVRLGGVPLVSSRSPDPKGWGFSLKYAFDRVAAALALVLIAPLIGALALAVLISSGRPILYRQQRIGRDGKRFDMFKFRSMRPATEVRTAVDLAEDLAPGGVEGADRRTRIGSLLRRTSLDELPQLLNVVRGDMSFIGPRPERPEFVEVFERRVHRYAERHRVKSGITGWAQVCGLRGKTSISDRIEWDIYYIENWSPWFDFKILLMTLVAVARPGKVE